MSGVHLKRLGERIAGFKITIWLVRILMRIGALFGRVASFVKIRAVMTVPPGTVCHWSVEIKYPENVHFEGPVVIGPETTLGGKGGITLGRNVRVSKGVLIETASLDLNASLPHPHVAKAVVIEEGVWLGAHAIVLGGVRIGANAVVGAGTVISRDVAPGAIVVGGPVREIERKERYGP